MRCSIILFLLDSLTFLSHFLWSEDHWTSLLFISNLLIWLLIEIYQALTLSLMNNEMNIRIINSQIKNTYNHQDLHHFLLLFSINRHSHFLAEICMIYIIYILSHFFIEKFIEILHSIFLKTINNLSLIFIQILISISKSFLHFLLDSEHDLNIHFILLLIHFYHLIFNLRFHHFHSNDLSDQASESDS